MNFPLEQALNMPVITLVPFRSRIGWVLTLSLSFGFLTSVAVISDDLLIDESSAQQSSAQQSSTEQSSVDLAGEVPIWIAELDAPTAKARREAEQRLIQAGPEVAEFVPVILDHLSIDARQRLQRIQKRWQASSTKSELKTTIVKMQNAKTLGDALEAISAASGVEFDTKSAGNAIDLSKTIRAPGIALGFWQSIDHVLDQVNLDINFYAGDRETLALVPRSPDRLSRSDSAAYSGIYRLEPTIVTARRVLGAPLQSGLNLTVAVSWQPNRTPIGLSIPITSLSGKLDNDVSLEPQASGKTIDIATSSELAMSQFYLPMQLPPRKFEMGGLKRRDQANGQKDATEIVRLSGEITALLPGERRRFELLIGDVSASSKQDAMTVSIESVRASDPLHEIRVSVELESAGRSLESHRQWIFENEAYVELPDGGRADHLGYEVYRQTGSGVGIGYLFDFGGAEVPPIGAKLIYESPTSVMKNEVPFLLNGIPLP